jgi:hypothetical protein
MHWMDYHDHPCLEFKEYLRGDCCCKTCGWTQQEHEAFTEVDRLREELRAEKALKAELILVSDAWQKRAQEAEHELARRASQDITQ